MTATHLAGEPQVEDITHDELVRTVLRIAEQQTTTQQQLSELIAQVSVLVVRAEQHESELRTLDNWQTWALRVVVGAVVLALLGLVFSGSPGVTGG